MRNNIKFFLQVPSLRGLDSEIGGGDFLQNYQQRRRGLLRKAYKRVLGEKQTEEHTVEILE